MFHVVPLAFAGPGVDVAIAGFFWLCAHLPGLTVMIKTTFFFICVGDLLQ